MSPVNSSSSYKSVPTTSSLHPQRRKFCAADTMFDKIAELKKNHKMKMAELEARRPKQACEIIHALGLPPHRERSNAQKLQVHQIIAEQSRREQDFPAELIKAQESFEMELRMLEKENEVIEEALQERHALASRRRRGERQVQSTESMKVVRKSVHGALQKKSSLPVQRSTPQDSVAGRQGAHRGAISKKQKHMVGGIVGTPMTDMEWDEYFKQVAAENDRRREARRREYRILNVASSTPSGEIA